MVRPNLPTYVSNGFLLPIVRGPYDNNDVEMANFLVKAKREALWAFCDEYINEPSGGMVRYVPLFSHLLMTYANLSGYVVDEAGQRVGLMREQDLVFWIIALAMKKSGGRWVPSHPVALPPLLFVDNPFGLAIGREVFGYPKSFGQFQASPSIRQPEFTLSSIVFDPANPESEGQMDWILRVAQRPGSHATPSTERAMQEAVGAHLSAEGGHSQTRWLKEGVALLMRLLQPRVSILFLKQFRSVEQTTKADVQQIIEEPTRVYTFKGGGFLQGRYQLSVNDVPFYPFKERLGIVLDDHGQQPLSLGFWAKVAFLVEEGKIVWELKR